MKPYNKTQQPSLEFDETDIVSPEFDASLYFGLTPILTIAWDKYKKEFFDPYITSKGHALSMSYGNVCGTYDPSYVVILRRSTISVKTALVGEMHEVIEGDILSFDKLGCYVVEFLAGDFYLSDIRKFNPNYEDNQIAQLSYDSLHNNKMSHHAFLSQYIGNVFSTPSIIFSY